MIIHIICYSILVILLFSFVVTARKYKKLYEGKKVNVRVQSLYPLVYSIETDVSMEQNLREEIKKAIREADILEKYKRN